MSINIVSDSFSFIKNDMFYEIFKTPFSLPSKSRNSINIVYWGFTNRINSFGGKIKHFQLHLLELKNKYSTSTKIKKLITNL